MNGDNFDLQLTTDFDLTDGGTVRFFYPEGKTTYSAQLRIFSDSGKFFVTQRSEWTQQQTQYQLADYVDALKYLPQAEIRARFPDAEGFYVSLTEEGAPEDYEDTADLSRKRRGEISGWQFIWRSRRGRSICKWARKQRQRRKRNRCICFMKTETEGMV